MNVNISDERLADLERRILALEERTRHAIWREEAARTGKEEELKARYGEYVDKTVAARILGVTRTTVYAMLADGRITGACAGRKVDVGSIAGYLTRSRGMTQGHGKQKNADKRQKREEKGHECA